MRPKTSEEGSKQKQSCNLVCWLLQLNWLSNTHRQEDWLLFVFAVFVFATAVNGLPFAWPKPMLWMVCHLLGQKPLPFAWPKTSAIDCLLPYFFVIVCLCKASATVDCCLLIVACCRDHLLLQKSLQKPLPLFASVKASVVPCLPPPGEWLRSMCQVSDCDQLPEQVGDNNKEERDKEVSATRNNKIIHTVVSRPACKSLSCLLWPDVLKPHTRKQARMLFFINLADFLAILYP